MIQVTVGRGGQLQGTVTHIIECLIVQDKALLSILHQLMDRQSGIVSAKGMDSMIRPSPQVLSSKET